MSRSGSPDFSVYPLRFEFEARQMLRFPALTAANVFRGALGQLLRRIAPSATAYLRIFAPRDAAHVPSGLADLPRPYVLRAAHLNGATLAARERFHLGLNLFDREADLERSIAAFTTAFTQFGQEGIGARRGRADLIEVIHPQAAVTMDFADLGQASAQRILMDFRTPTELKQAGEIATDPDFGIIFRRARDRISALGTLYGGGPIAVDFAALGQRADRIRTDYSALTRVDAPRRSSRTGQVHGIGGLIGEMKFSGELGEFLPWLQAAEWAGIGRHTVWGNGEIHTRLILDE